MFTWDYNLFIGDDTTDIHIAFATGERTFIIGEVKATDEGESLKDSLDKLKDSLDAHMPNSLEEVVKGLDAGISMLDKTLVSLAVVYIIGDIAYLVTKGKGEIYVSRKGQMKKLLEGNNTASGIIKKGDYILLANKSFSASADEVSLKRLLFNTKPQEIVETITPELKASNNIGMIALFMQAGIPEEGIAETEVEEDTEDESYVSPSTATAQDIPTKLPRKMPKIQLPALLSRFGQGTTRGKQATFVIVLILIAILSWSVISGNSRRERSQFLETVTQQKQEIESKMTEAQDLAGVNTQKSLSLIDESRSALTSLEQEAKDKKIENVPELAELTALINKTEQSIRKTEEGQYEEYYDLDLIAKGAEAQHLYSDGETLAMLDSDAGKIYMLNIEEKSVSTYSTSKAKDATSVAIHQDTPFFFGKDIGVIKMTDKTTVEEIIPPDKDLGTVKDFWMYNGNVYLLDTSHDEIYKYLVAEEGYSNKKSYFGEGQSIELGKATAMAIDGSVYVAAGGNTHKYVSGVREVFNIAVPDGTDITYEDVYADRDTDYVYFLDKDTARIIVALKDAEFEKQISASILKNADDFVVHPNAGILVLSENVIYAIEN